ncbi:nucleotidyltransferase family protein [Cellulomonas palmilytica]|uniref:nucleotidyltransferase family protein n=1 Tax=Cellulomonas palmilytica TaxID=2608402 RepID=UPI0029500126|nr:nucleotidyltransferase family protein [Cellulomonas palmilytica]
MSTSARRAWRSCARTGTACGASRIAHRHGASNVRVFGSVARGEDGPDSDIDLLVDLDVHTRGLLPLGAIADEVSALLSERVDVAPASALAPHVADSASAEAVRL